MWDLVFTLAGVVSIVASVGFLGYGITYLLGVSDDSSRYPSSEPADLMYTGIVGTIGGVIFALFGIVTLRAAYQEREPTSSIKQHFTWRTLMQEVPRPVSTQVIAFTIVATIIIYQFVDPTIGLYHQILRTLNIDETSTADLNETSTAISPKGYSPYFYNHTHYDGRSNFTVGIKLEVPYEWLISNLIKLKMNDRSLTFETQKSLPGNMSNNEYSATVSVGFEEIPKNMSLEEFTQGKIENLQTNQSFHLIASNSTTLSGDPAHQIVFTYQTPTGEDFKKGNANMDAKI